MNLVTFASLLIIKRLDKELNYDYIYHILVFLNEKTNFFNIF